MNMDLNIRINGNLLEKPQKEVQSITLAHIHDLVDPLKKMAGLNWFKPPLILEWRGHVIAFHMRVK